MRSILAASDFHFPHASPEAVREFLAFAAKRKPDTVVLNGDVLDGSLTLAEELGPALAFLVKLRAKIGPLTPIRFVVGNHDVCHRARGELSAEFRRRLASALTGPVGPMTVRESHVDGPFVFTHGVKHEDFYTQESYRHYLLSPAHRTVFVVGHTHRPQSCTHGGSAVYGLPCMAKQDVVGAALGWGLFWRGGAQRGHEIVTL